MSSSKEGKRTCVVVSDSKSTRIIPMDMITYVEACGPYSLLYNKNGEEIVWCKHLKVVQTLLDADVFLRIHKGHLVNLREVIQYKHGRGGRVVLSTGVQLDVSFRKKAEFLERYKLVN